MVSTSVRELQRFLISRRQLSRSCRPHWTRTGPHIGFHSGVFNPVRRRVFGGKAIHPFAPEHAVGVAVPTCPFDLDALKTRTGVASLVYHETVESTNDLALELATKGICPPGPPLLVLTSQQTRGRGRRGRRWDSSPGSLTFSLLFTHSTPPPLHKLPTLALAVALGISRALTSYLANSSAAGGTATAQLKWPNDVLVGTKKISGVLVEPRPASPNTLSAVVVGVGINVNNRIENDLSDQATSLATELGTTIPLSDCLLKVLNHIEHEVEAWRANDPQLPLRWNQSLRSIDRHVAIDTPIGTVTGTCRGIDPEGRLLIENSAGVLQQVVSEIVPET